MTDSGEKVEGNMLFLRILSEDSEVDVESLIDRMGTSSFEVVSELCGNENLRKSTKDILFEDLVLSQATREETIEG